VGAALLSVVQTAELLGQILFFLPLQPTVAAAVVIGVRTELLAVPAAVAAAVLLQQVAQATHHQLVRPKEVLEVMAQMTQ